MRDISKEIETFFEEYEVSESVKVALGDCYEIITDSKTSDEDKTHAKIIAEYYLSFKDVYDKKEKNHEKK